MELKQSRPFLVLIVKIDGYTFAIPFRTNVRHNYCYKFKKTGRETATNTALDFTKAVIIIDLKYIGVTATIDHDEYIELSSKPFFIIKSLNLLSKSIKG